MYVGAALTLVARLGQGEGTSAPIVRNREGKRDRDTARSEI